MAIYKKSVAPVSTPAPPRPASDNKRTFDMRPSASKDTVRGPYDRFIRPPEPVAEPGLDPDPSE